MEVDDDGRRRARLSRAAADAVGDGAPPDTVMTECHVGADEASGSGGRVGRQQKGQRRGGLLLRRSRPRRRASLEG